MPLTTVCFEGVTSMRSRATWWRWCCCCVLLSEGNNNRDSRKKESSIDAPHQPTAHLWKHPEQTSAIRITAMRQKGQSNRNSAQLLVSFFDSRSHHFFMASPMLCRRCDSILSSNVAHNTLTDPTSPLPPTPSHCIPIATSLPLHPPRTHTFLPLLLQHTCPPPTHPLFRTPSHERPLRQAVHRAGRREG